MKRNILMTVLATTLALAGGICSAAATDTYPTQPLQLVIPYTPGGGADVIGRIVAQAASNELKQPLVILNRPGAGTIVGAEFVSRAEPDGYTMLLADSGTLSTNQSLYKSLPYVAEDDFALVALITDYPFLLVSREGFEPKTINELLDYVRAHPGEVNFASPGPGSPHHLSMELFMEETNTKMTHIPYKGAAPAVQGLLSNQVDVMFLDLAAGQHFVREGKLHAYAAATEQRLADFQDLPTLHESGVNGFTAGTWTGIVVPKGTPETVINRLNEAFNAALSNDEIAERLRSLGVIPIPGTIDDFKRHVQSESERWTALIKAKGIRLQ
ncbi:MAG: Bug family tripartite tricarboxylate transporter substrate binding protein [Pigmentiphaga sp.]